MKKFLLFILLIANLFLLFPVSSVKAQTTPNFKLTLPGVNCGRADDISKNQCCNVSYPSSFIPPDMGPLNAVISSLSFFTNFARDNFLQPVLDLYGELVNKNVSGCYVGVQSVEDANDLNCKCINPITPSPGYLSALNDFCQRQANVADRSACLACANDGGVYSGIGCVKTESKKFIEETVFGLGLGLAGGFALLCIIFAAFQMQSSQGNPEKLKKAQEMLTSCIMGLMLIIFSVFILRLIGVSILRVPGFS
jgi:hypothetical protein